MSNRIGNHVQLPEHLRDRLKAVSAEVEMNLKRKLDRLWDPSDWNTAGNMSLQMYQMMEPLGPFKKYYD